MDYIPNNPECPKCKGSGSRPTPFNGMVMREDGSWEPVDYSPLPAFTCWHDCHCQHPGLAAKAEDCTGHEYAVVIPGERVDPPTPITFTDDDGVEWELRAFRAYKLSRVATPDDLGRAGYSRLKEAMHWYKRAQVYRREVRRMNASLRVANLVARDQAERIAVLLKTLDEARGVSRET